MVEAGSTVADYKAFRSVTTQASVSMLNCNLSANNGSSFITCKNTNEGGTISLYGADVVSQQADSVSPQVTLATHKSDCMNAQFVKVQGTSYVVICHLQTCKIYN